MPSPRQAALFGGGFSPYTLADNAAVYSLSGSASDSAYLIDGSNRLYYVADRSRNSAVNVLLLPQVTGNRCSLTTGTAIGTGDVSVSLTFQAALSATTAGVMSLSSSASTNNVSRAFFCETRSSGEIEFNLLGATTSDFRRLSVANFSSTYTGQVVTVTFTRTGTTFAAYVTTAAGVTATLSGSETTGGTPPDWSDTITSTSTNIGFNSGVETQPGAIYRAAVYSKVLSAAEIIANAAGTIQSSNVVFVDFGLAAKFATSFTATSGQTVTVTQSAIALPARIHGARDLYQGVQANQPIFSVSGGYNIATFDGSNDYLKSAAFSLSQPESVYFTGSQVGFTDGDTVWDGNTQNNMRCYQKTSAPNLNFLGGTPDVAGVTDMTVGVRAVLSTVYSGSSSSQRKNISAAITRTTGTTAASGFTVGADGNVGNSSNITWSEALLRSAADADALQLRIAAYEMRRWGVTP